MTARAAELLAALALSVLLLAVARADPARGERVFQRCYACHSVVAGEDGLPGPNLHDVVGRRAASVAAFPFSPAMREAGAHGLVWTRSTLDRFLADPRAVVPGTEMSMSGLAEPRDRDDVVDYLEQAGARSAGGGSRPEGR
jgi:cytochrome c